MLESRDVSEALSAGDCSKQARCMQQAVAETHVSGAAAQKQTCGVKTAVTSQTQNPKKIRM